jgi:hypothetical protein
MNGVIVQIACGNQPTARRQANRVEFPNGRLPQKLRSALHRFNDGSGISKVK